MKFGVLCFSIVALPLVLAINIGDNGFGYPRPTDYPQGTHEVNYAQAYFNRGGSLQLKDSTRFRYQLAELLLLSFEKKYLSNKLTMGLQTHVNTAWGPMDVGVRNLGTSYADTTSPFGQEFVTCLVDMTKLKLTLGVQRMINNGADYLDPILSAQSTFLGRFEMDVFLENRAIGIGLSVPIDDRLRVSLLGMAPVPNQDQIDYRSAEISFTWLMQPSLSQNMANPLSQEQDQKIYVLQSRLTAMETLYSETFQKKLLNELLSQQLVDRKYTDNETDRLKLTLQSLKKGTELFYARDYEHASEEYQKANTLYPNLPVVHASLGSLHYVMGHFEKAKLEWQLWLSLDPTSDEARESLAKLQREHPNLFAAEGAAK